MSFDFCDGGSRLSYKREISRILVLSSYQRPIPLTIPEELPEPGTALETIFALLKSTAGFDFTQYKPATLNRRMQRRMLLYKLESLEAYAQYLLEHPAEVKALYEEILIHVTSFFRDLEVFQHLKEQVFPTITQNKSAEVPIRIWVAGCSTGEEVYSIAICLLEYLGDRGRSLPIQIFATDISEAAIANQEKTMAQAHLQAVIEEQDNLNQDLRVANEEIISSNEELQSINEELETAKEEIQATNEELITTVEELRTRNLDLQQVNNDVTNFWTLDKEEKWFAT
ncbi:MAG: hypothetical protein HC789_09575 [Microcoleus sp. CSU_2_2]|nr:hypothetical protein [Microcoleus sp. SU_5_3]NJS10606.1 hypothetical protein [Microcoleus sp. CSU_2_2]